jgi:CheY-like chemotaxis protein
MKRQRILVVEDDQDIRSTLVELLQDEGYAVEAVRDGQSALEAVGTLHPSAILLDLMMPVMDGWAFLSACRGDARCRDIPIVVISAAYNLHRHVKQLTDQGVRAIISKPFDLQTLLTTVQRYAPIPA